MVVSSHDRAIWREDRAKRFDRLADRILAGLAPLSFETADTPTDRDAVLRMRYGCVVELGWARPEDYPDGREGDEYDDGATFVVCRDGDENVGSARVVPPAAGRLLPMEREFGLRAGSVGEAFEVGRIVVPRSYRPGRSHLVIAGLAARCWLVGHALGCTRVVSTATADVLDLYRSLGMQVSVLGPSRVYWGEERVPFEISADEEAAFLKRLALAGPQ